MKGVETEKEKLKMQHWRQKKKRLKLIQNQPKSQVIEIFRM